MESGLRFHHGCASNHQMISGVSGSSSFPLCNAHCRWDDTIAPQRRVGVVEKVVTTLAFTTATATSFPHDIEIAQSQDHQTAGSQDGLHPRKSHCWSFLCLLIDPGLFFLFPTASNVLLGSREQTVELRRTYFMAMLALSVLHISGTIHHCHTHRSFVHVSGDCKSLNSDMN